MNFKEIIRSLKDPDKKLYFYTVVLVGIIILIILITLIVKLIIGKRMTYEQIESVMVQSTKKYAESTNMLLENDSFNKVIKTSTLIQKEYMKEFKKYNRKAELCTGTVTITYNGDKFLYTPYLDCGKDYKTKYLNDIIKNSKLTDNKEGIYPVGDYYIYKGENPNNYIKFADELWRIVKVENDGTIKIMQVNSNFDRTVFDDRYNSSCPERKYNCAGFNNFETSRLKDYMLEIFEIGYENYKYEFELSNFEKKIINHQQLCIGGVSEDLKLTAGYPECSLKTEKKYPFDFIKLNEYIMPSLDSGCKGINDPECTNYNYMIDNASYWTITPTDQNTYQVFYINLLPDTSYVSSEKRFCFVMNLNKNTLYKSGKGTEESPYIIKNVTE